ncbi:hypothetical protein [Luteolibacter sp. AS25]|uniref:TPM domain-containing protein n=1 Tax=Luteolibacter sp. AS25 TaxID=3135776 RepID=UPI00398AE227
MKNKGVPRSLLTTFLLLFFTGIASAQRLPDSDIPPPPVTGVSDPSDILGKDSEISRKIVGMIQELRAKHGYNIYLILERSFIGTNTSDYAAQLQNEWAPDGGGLVVIYESDTKRLGFGRDLGASTNVESSPSKVPSYLLLDIIASAVTEAEEEKIAEVYLDNLITNITVKLEEYFTRKENPESSGRSLRLALVTIGALSLLALCGMGLGWLMGKSDTKQSVTKVFPQTDIPERLGAPYGGGAGATSFFGIDEKKSN